MADAEISLVQYLRRLHDLMEMFFGGLVWSDPERKNLLHRSAWHLTGSPGTLESRLLSWRSFLAALALTNELGSNIIGS